MSDGKTPRNLKIGRTHCTENFSSRFEEGNSRIQSKKLFSKKVSTSIPIFIYANFQFSIKKIAHFVIKKRTVFEKLKEIYFSSKLKRK